MEFKRIEKNQTNNGFQKVVNQNGETNISASDILYTYCDLSDKTDRPYGNLFKSFKLPITNNESLLFNNTFKDTSFEYFSNVNKLIVAEIPKGSYGELIDGKTFSLNVPYNTGFTTLYATYFNFNQSLNSQISDNNTFSSVFGIEPNEDNGFNSNVAYLFSNDISKANLTPTENLVYETTIRFDSGVSSIVLPSGLTTGQFYRIDLTITSRRFTSLDLDNYYATSPLNSGNTTGDIKINTLSKYEGLTNINRIILKRNSSVITEDIYIKLYTYTQNTANWSRYTTSNKFPSTAQSISGKRYATFNGTTKDKPVGIIYLDKGLAVITDSTLINNFNYSAGSYSTGYNGIPSGQSYTSDTKFSKIYFSSSTNSQATYNSITTEYSQQIVCLALPGEFNGTTNPTFVDSYDESTTKKPVFITKIGMYNKFGELIAISVLSEPYQKNNQIPAFFSAKLKI